MWDMGINADKWNQWRALGPIYKARPEDIHGPIWVNMHVSSPDTHALEALRQRFPLTSCC
jgi:hypothetical protein